MYDSEEESRSICHGHKNTFSTLHIFDLALNWTRIAGFVVGRSPFELAGLGAAFQICGKEKSMVQNVFNSKKLFREKTLSDNLERDLGKWN